MIAAVLNQFCGINAVNVNETLILSGVPGLNITVGNDVVALAGLFGTILGPILNRCISIKNLFLIGEVLMCVVLALAALF